MSIRPIKRLIQATPTIEGAGVKLRRAFGFGETESFDPFLLLDGFRNEKPEDYLAGFPWHPHRGIETITYVLSGSVDHGDSMGNKGTITTGDVQWMTAGRGIIQFNCNPLQVLPFTIRSQDLLSQRAIASTRTKSGVQYPPIWKQQRHAQHLEP